jgi:serine/threonine protein phosphatase 1
VSLPYETFISDLPQAHLAFLADLELFCRIEDTVFIHGGLDPSAGPVENQAKEALLWGADDFLKTYEGPDLIVYGHWNNAVVDENGWPMPRFSKSAIGLDTIHHGVLSAVVLPGGRILQSARHA